jgi:hypothetical protein
LNLALIFNAAYAGTKNIYMYAAKASGQNSGWQQRGTWTVPPGAAPVVTADSVTPNTGTGASTVFALQYSDTAGFADLSTTWVWVNATFATSAANSCLVYYNRATNLVWLLNDAGTQWTSGSVPAAGTLENTQCTISLAGSTVQHSGNTLTLNLAMTFTAAYAGTKNIFMYAANATGQSSNWQLRGAWNVPAF